MKVLDALYELSEIKKDSVIFEDEIYGGISYRDFELATGRLYRALSALQLPKEAMIAIRVKRSYRTYIAIVGALKAALPYVVIGDTSPSEYVEQVYAECEPALTLDDAFLDRALKEEYLPHYKARDIHDLALVIYSTGSSGFFKGSMHEYGIIDKIFSYSSVGREIYRETAAALETMSFFLLAGFYGASAIEDLINVTVYRSKLVIIPEEKCNDVDYLIEMARKHRVYTMEANPLTLPEFVKNPESTIREYYVAYEMFPCKYSPDYKVYNGYGLSEACGTLCFKEIEKDYDIAPVGTPVPLWEVKLLNRDQRQTETDEIGELCFVPEYFRGYIKRPELYRSAFYGGYFHTGDLGYYNENHDIVIIGRKRDMKETAEGYIVPIFIQNAILKAFPDISKCLVKVFTDEEPTMTVAYYISEREHTLEEINAGIACTIAPFALPTHAVRLSAFEYFRSGKLNRNLFFKPDDA